MKKQPTTTMAGILLGTTGYAGYNYTPAQAPDQLYYEVLEMSLAELEQRKTVRVVWLSEGIAKEETHDLLVHKQSQFTDVLVALQKRAGLPDEILDQIRFYEVHGSKVYKILPPTQSVASLNEFMTVYAERIPDDEKTLDKEKGDRLTNCFHFEREPAKSHGVPFIFLLKGGETFEQTKGRLSKRTGIKGKNLEKVKFAVIRGGQSYSRPQWIEDSKSRPKRNETEVTSCADLFTADVLSEKMSADDHLGLEHPNRNRNNYLKHESLNIR